jgi:acyl-CoA thioester hydrolase
MSHLEMKPEEHPEYFVHEFDIPASAIDRNNHVNNVFYVQWVQDISIMHSDARNGTALMETLGAAWMVHTHHIEYKAQAFLGERLRATTWVGEYAHVSCKRFCRFERISDGKLILTSETTWVLVDLKRGRPIAIPESLQNLFRLKD